MNGLSSLWFDLARVVPPYPEGTVAVPEPIRGTAFFPGGRGIWLEGASESLPKPIMVVGQDFNTVASYQRALEAGTEVSLSVTWRNLLKAFPLLELPLQDCFFTNFYMGLRVEGPETGRFPGAKDPGFRDRCAAFFLRQLEVIGPETIIALGLEPLRAMARHVFHFDVPARLSDCMQVYSVLTPLRERVSLLALTHPAFYFANVRRRRFDGRSGIEAERAMIAAARGR